MVESSVTPPAHTAEMNQRRNRTVDELIMEGAGQTGFVTSQWLTDQGVSPGGISRRVRSGQLERFCRGHYLVPALRRPDTILRIALSALPESAAGFETAGRLHGFGVPATPIVVVQQAPSSIQIPGVRVVRSRRFNPAETHERLDGLRLTSPTQTLFDIGRTWSGKRLIHLLETQFIAKRPTAEAFQQFVLDNRGKGVRNGSVLVSVLEEMLDDQPFPESVLEQIMFEGLAERGVVLTRQFRPPWYDGRRGIVDACEPIGATIAEADGRRFRQVSQAHDNDRRRDLVAMSHSYCVVRASHYMMTRESSRTFDQMAEVIVSRREAATRRAAG